MSDTLTAEERALIEAAVQNGKVQKIPQGQSGEPVVKRFGVGRRRNLKKISAIKTLALNRLDDKQIADSLGTTRKAVSNYRYRYDIESGFARRRKTR